MGRDLRFVTFYNTPNGGTRIRCPALLSFRHEWLRDYLILEITPAMIDRAIHLVEIHGLCAYDAVHLGAALETQEMRRQMGLPTLVIVSADDNQGRLPPWRRLLASSSPAMPSRSSASTCSVVPQPATGWRIWTTCGRCWRSRRAFCLIPDRLGSGLEWDEDAIRHALL